MLQDRTDDVNISSGNGLVVSGNKPLPEPLLTQIYAAMSQWLDTKLQHLQCQDDRCINPYRANTELTRFN